MAVYIIEIDS